MELRCTGDTFPNSHPALNKAPQDHLPVGLLPLDLQSKLLRMLLLRKVSYMPVVRWQGWKAATGKWQHRCRKDDCDTSENPNGKDIKASSYVYQVPSCWNMQWAFTPAGYCSASSPSCQCTVNHFGKTRDLGKPFLLSRKAGKGIKKSTLFPLHYWSGHETEKRSNFGGVCFCHSDSLKGSKRCMYANDITKHHSKGRVVILWALLSTVWNQGLDLVTACFKMLYLSTVFILDRTIIENERMKIQHHVANQGHYHKMFACPFDFG